MKIIKLPPAYAFGYSPFRTWADDMEELVLLETDAAAARSARLNLARQRGIRRINLTYTSKGRRG